MRLQEMRRLIDGPASFKGVFKGFSAFLAQVRCNGGRYCRGLNAGVDSLLVFLMPLFCVVRIISHPVAFDVFVLWKRTIRRGNKGRPWFPL